MCREREGEQRKREWVRSGGKEGELTDHKAG